MPTYQKKIIFFLCLVAVAFGVNIVPQSGKVITAKDDLKVRREGVALAPLESQAALLPTSNSLNSEMQVGPRHDAEGTSRIASDLEKGAFAPLSSSFDPPFRQSAEVIPPEVGATIFFVGDLESGTSYIEKGVSRHWPIASITKLMTAVVASQVLSPETVLTLSPENFLKEEGAGSSYLKSGEEYRIRDLMEVLLVASDNVAAEALASAYGREKFIAKMNKQAELWGMSQTYYYDPSGLSPVNQSSVEDLKKLAFQLLNHYENILDISRKPGVRVLEQSSKAERSVFPINTFAGRSDFIGGKTGFIDEAGGNLLSIFSVKGRPILIVVFNSSSRFGDTTTLLNWFKENYQ